MKFILITILMFTPYILLAQESFIPLTDLGGAINENSSDLNSYINTILSILIGAVATLSAIMIAIGGFRYMTTDAVGGKGDAKNRMKYAIFGLLLALGSYVILKTINPNLLKVNLNIEKVGVKDPDQITIIKGDGDIPSYVITDLGNMTDEEKIEWLKKYSETVNSTDTKNIQVTTFGGPNDSGVSINETGSVTGERLRSLNPNEDYYIAYPLLGHNIKGLPQLSGGGKNVGGGGTASQTASVNKDLNNYYIQIEANGKIVNARIIDRGPSQGNNITNGSNKLDASNAVWKALGVPNGSTGQLTSVKLIPKSGSSGIVK